jgi:GNAT superfamily N-acetyltransferase
VISRAFEGPADLAAMKLVLCEGRLVSPRSGYWHPGELDWWFGYIGGFASTTRVWVAEPGLAGWVVADPRNRVADMAVRPDLRGGDAEAELLAGAEELLGAGKVAVFAWANDPARADLLARAGYTHEEPQFQTFLCTLAAPVEVPELPAGFRILPALTDDWVAERAECHHRAFDPSRMTAERYGKFRAASGYDPELDVAVVSDDGRVVAYTMAWADTASSTAQFEPVGTRPHFWRRGLGRVANREALRRLQERGVRLTTVNTYAGHAGNIAFYESCGFERVTTIDRWSKVTTG